jgi:hypothetical protein
VKTITRGGIGYRVADPEWEDPLDGRYSMKFGGRWNSPGSFPVVYLNADLTTAKSNARRLLDTRLRGSPFSVDDLELTQLPLLVTVRSHLLEHVDVVTTAGMVANGLPSTYPLDARGNSVSHVVCQPIGQRAWDDALAGVACVSADSAAPDGEELAWFDRLDSDLELIMSEPFDRWFGPIDW